MHMFLHVCKPRIGKKRYTLKLDFTKNDVAMLSTFLARDILSIVLNCITKEVYK